MPINQKQLENKRKKQFINQTFSDFRQELLQYANTFYRENIVDFSEVSLGGMLLDFAAIVGDSLVYYAEQQFNELNYETATDPDNIVKHLRRANIKNSKASPSSVEVSFSVEIEKEASSKDYDPQPSLELLPIIKKGTRLKSKSGILFSLQEDVDFRSGYVQEIGEENADGSIFSLFLTKKGICISGQISEEEFTFSDKDNDYFLSVSLSQENITDIISIVDDQNNEYYEVDYLSQTTVYKKVEDSNDKYMTILPAPYRFIKEEVFDLGKTILRFGNGNGKSVKDNVFYNPEDLLLPLKGKDVINRVDLDPGILLQNSTLGVSPSGSTLTVLYKHGGGISHNVPARSINKIVETPIITFPNSSENTLESEITQVTNSISVFNEDDAIGGTQPLSLNELKEKIPSTLRAQSRIITSEDLLSRILTMPSDFGRINKIAALDGLFNSSAKDLFVACKDSSGFYINASDAIKTNLSNYINEYRLIGDSFNILDVPVYNFGLSFKVKLNASKDITTTLSDIKSRIIENMRFDLFQIGSPINVSKIEKIILDTDGVGFLITPKISLIVSKSAEDAFFDTETIEEKTYNDNVFNPQILFNKVDGMIYPPRGGIFEIRYTSEDITIFAN